MVKVTSKVIIFFGFFIFVDSHSKSDQWWKSANFYQISPASFKDSNNDGYGDIRGIISNLNYLVETGFDALFLSPFYKTPFKDYGYDISSYTEIEPKFGSEEDVDELLREAKRNGIKVIVDFVPNHSSNEHEWFIKSKNGTEDFKDFYIWHSGVPSINGLRPLPPNNWQSVYGGSSWEWSDDRQAYYYHTFGKMQPDLNLHEKRVLDELENVLLFWLHKGVDGFRVDAVSQLFEDPDFVKDPSIFNNLPETYELVETWRHVVDNFTITNGGDERILIPQVWESKLDDLVKYIQNENGDDVAQLPTNFIICNNLDRTSHAIDFKRTIDSYLMKLPKNAVANWFLGTHDHSRVASRMEIKQINGITMLLLTLPGVAFTYSGDEILMLDFRDISWDDTTDPWACNSNPNDYKELSRDPQRTPFQWSSAINAGFNIGTPTRIPVHPNFTENNLESQKISPESHYKYYKQLLQLRKNKAFVEGDFVSKDLSENVFGYSRSIDDGTFVILINLGSNTEMVNMNDLRGQLRNELSIVLTSSFSLYKVGDVVASDNVVLEPFDALIAQDLSNATEIC